MRTLALDRNEKTEDLLALAIRLIEVEDARTIENLTHLAEACKTYRRAHPCTPEHIKSTLTPHYILDVLIPEICDNLMQDYLDAVLDRMAGDLWNELHPVQGQMPESVRNTIHALRCNDSQTWRKSEELARSIEKEWAEKLEWYQGQFDRTAIRMACLMHDRLNEDIRRQHSRRE